MSAAKGVDYLDSRLEEYLCGPPNSITSNHNASVVGYVMKHFESKGTSTPGQWHMATVEWLLVHIITEVGVTPHNFREGRNIGGIMEAYEDILRELVCTFLSHVLTQNPVNLTPGLEAASVRSVEARRDSDFDSEIPSM
jgi:hypothetical protein